MQIIFRYLGNQARYRFHYHLRTIMVTINKLKKDGKFYAWWSDVMNMSREHVGTPCISSSSPQVLCSSVVRASNWCTEDPRFASCLGLRFCFFILWITSLLTRIQARCVLRSLINPFFILLLEQVNTAKDEGISVCSCWYCNWFNQCCFLGNPVLPFILANREKRRKKNRLEKLRKKKKKEAQITKETASGT